MRIILASLLIVLFIQCASKKQTTAVEVLTIEGNWQLEKLSGFSTPLDSLNKIPTLRISLSDSSYSGSSSCNNYMGKFFMKEKAIQFKPAMMTKMFCAQNFNMEPSYMEALGKTDSYTLSNSKLILYKKGSELAVFSPIAD